MPWANKTPEVIARIKEGNRRRYHELKERTPFKHKCLYKASTAKREGLEFNLTPEYLEQLWTGYCSISGIPIFLYNERVAEDHAELDRVDPRLGYTIGNVLWLSRKYNRLKGNATAADLRLILNWMEAQCRG